jgi:hypothetical protein
VFQEKRLRDQGTDATRSEQPGQRGDQVDNKNGQIAHRRIVPGSEILRNHGRNNNSPGTAMLLISALAKVLARHRSNRCAHFRESTNQHAIPNRRTSAKEKEIPLMWCTTIWRTTTQGRKNYGRNHSRLYLLTCGADLFDKSSIFGLIAQVFEDRVTREIQQVALTLIECCLQVLKGVLLFA